MKKLGSFLIISIFVLSCTQNTNINKPIIKKEEIKVSSESPEKAKGDKVVFKGKTFNDGEEVPDILIRNELYNSFILNQVYVYDLNTKTEINNVTIDNKTDIFSLKAIEKTSTSITFEVTEYDYFYNIKTNVLPYTKTITVKKSNSTSNTIIDFIGLQNASIYQDIKAEDLAFKSQISYILDKTERVLSQIYLYPAKTYLKKFFSFNAIVDFNSLEIPVSGKIQSDIERGIYINLTFSNFITNENTKDKRNITCKIKRDFPAENFILDESNKGKINVIRIEPLNN